MIVLNENIADTDSKVIAIDICFGEIAPVICKTVRSYEKSAGSSAKFCATP